MTGNTKAKPPRHNASSSERKLLLDTNWPKKPRTHRTRPSRFNSRKLQDIPIKKRIIWLCLWPAIGNPWMVDTIENQRTETTAPFSSKEGKDLPIKKRLIWPAPGYHWMVKTIDSYDISSYIILNKEDVEQYISPFLNGLSDEELQGCGRSIKVWDTDKNTEHTLLLKRVISLGRRLYFFSGTWKEDFVDRRYLEAGDQVAFCWDEDASRFNFSAKLSE